MIKYIEGESADTAFYNKEIDSIFAELYKESPQYWNNGISRNLFNGVGDKIFIIRDPNIEVEEELEHSKLKKLFNKAIGFFGIQKYRRNKAGHLVHVLSVGLLPQHRKKGLAKQVALYLLPKILKEDDPTEIIWSCHVDNIPSQKLFAAIHDAKVIKAPFNLELFKDNEA